MSEAFTKFDPTEYLTTEEQIESYLAVAKEAKDPIPCEQACEIAERAGKIIVFEKFRSKSCFAKLKE